MATLILASTSPRRQELLRQAGFAFQAVAPNYEERFDETVEAHELVVELAMGKAGAVAANYPDDVVLGADTFITCDGRQLGKPFTAERASEMLHMLRGRTHVVITGFAIIGGGRAAHVEAIASEVTMRDLTEEEIDAYIATGEPLDRAGAYALQERGGAFINHVNGDYNAIIGLPLSPVIVALRKYGIVPTD